MIAVVGASTNPDKHGHKVFRDLLETGYMVVPVNPTASEILGQATFAQLSEISPPPELVISVVPPKITKQIVQQMIALKLPRIWMQPGSESKEAVALAKKAGIEVTTNACFLVQKKVWGKTN